MKYINSKYFFELDEITQDIIAREFVEDFDKGYNPEDFKDEVIELYEYDPNIKSDRNILEDFLSQKISNEGEPSEEDLTHYLENPSELLSFPILIKQGTCEEGRHRLTVSLKLNHKIRALVF